MCCHPLELWQAAEEMKKITSRKEENSTDNMMNDATDGTKNDGAARISERISRMRHRTSEKTSEMEQKI